MVRILDLLIVAGTAHIEYPSAHFGPVSAVSGLLLLPDLRDAAQRQFSPYPNRTASYIIRFGRERSRLNGFSTFWWFWRCIHWFSQDYRGLATVGRWSTDCGCRRGFGGFRSGADGAFSLQPAKHHADADYYYRAERAVYFSLVVFLLTILGLLMQYPITLSRNIIVHSIVFSVYFLGNYSYLLGAVSMFGTAVRSRWSRWPSMAWHLGALVAWLAMLNPAGRTA